MRNILNPWWQLIVNTAPQVVLFFMYFNSFQIIESLLEPETIQLWKVFGGSLFVLWFANLVYTLLLISRKKEVHIAHSYITLITYAALLYVYMIYSYELVPWSIPRWMIPDELIMYAGSFIMPCLAFSLFTLVIKYTPKGRNYKPWLNFLYAVIIPIFWYVFMMAISPMFRVTESRYMEHVLAVLMVSSTILFIFFTGRAIFILTQKNGAKWKGYSLFWKIPIALIFPLAGLMVNINFHGIFGDFSNPWFFIIAVINGVAICIPETTNKTYRLILFLIKSITFTYTLFFFFVFLPYLPLSIIAIFAFGAGFLMLAPLALFIIHLQSLKTDYVFFKQYFSPVRISLGVILCLFVIPSAITIRNVSDRNALQNALNYVYEADLGSGGLSEVNVKSLRRVLSNVKKYKGNNFGFGNTQTPFLARYYNWVVLDNLTLTNEKINTLNEVFTGEKYLDQRGRNLLFGNGDRKGPKISGIDVSTVFNENQDYWITTVELNIAHQEAFMGEYETTFELPDGAWISDYYLWIEGEKVNGLLAEKKAATWVYQEITRGQRDPGIMYYTGGNTVGFKVFPFATNETRTTGFEIIHKEPTSLIIDGSCIPLGKEGGEVSVEEPVRMDNGITYVPKIVKESLSKVKRKPYFHFIVDCSNGKKHLAKKYIKSIEYLIEQESTTLESSRISYVSSSVLTKGMNEKWVEDLNHQSFSGGFFCDRAIKKELYNSYQIKEDLFPVFVVITNDFSDAILLDDNFSNFKITYPDNNLFFSFENDTLFSHSLLQNSRKWSVFNGRVFEPENVLAWPSEKEIIAWLPDDNEGSVVLENDLIKLDESFLKGKRWISGLNLQGAWLSQNFHHDNSGQTWLNQVKGSFRAKIMTPFTSYISLENKAQRNALLQKQADILSGKYSLDAGSDVNRMSEPRLILIIILLGLYFIIKRRKKLVIRYKL